MGERAVVTKRVGRRGGLVAILAVAGAFVGAVPAQAQRYWEISPVASSRVLWLGPTASSPSGVVSLGVPTANNLGQHWIFRGGNLISKNLIITNRQTGTCLTVRGMAINAPVVLGSCFNPVVWLLYWPGGIGPVAATNSTRGFQIRGGYHANQCLGVPYFQYGAGTQMRTYACGASPNQLWRLTSFED